MAGAGRTYRGTTAEFWIDLQGELPAIVTTSEVGELLVNAGISGLPAEGVEAVRKALCVLRLPREEVALGNAGKWPVSILHDLLPKVTQAAHDFGDQLIAIIKRRDAVQGGTATRDACKPRLDQILAFLEAAESLAANLPPAPPRQVAWWHDDAWWLSRVIADQARAAGLTIGMSRPDSKGVRFVTAALHRIGAPHATAGAVAKVVRAP
jgi:hypothetical protein